MNSQYLNAAVSMTQSTLPAGAGWVILALLAIQAAFVCPRGEALASTPISDKSLHAVTADSQTKLQQALVAYFHESEQRTSRAFLERVQELSGGDWAVVAPLLTSLPLWKSKAQVATDGSIAVAGKSYRYTIQRMPDDPSGLVKIVAFVAPESQGARLTALVKEVSKESAKVGIVTIDPRLAPDFYDGEGEAQPLHQFLVQLRSRMRVASKLTLVGDATPAGQAAWHAAIYYPDLFDVLRIDASTPDLPYPSQSYRMFLPQLVRVHLHGTWTAKEAVVTDGAVYPANRAILLAACLKDEGRGVSFTIEEGRRSVEWGLSDSILHLRSNPEAALLNGERNEPIQTGGWFRYPGQGPSDWLIATKIRKPIWAADQIAIEARPGEDADAFVARTLKSKLYHLSGKIEGQAIHISSYRVQRIEVRPSVADIDFDKPVIIICNGRKRFEGMLEANLETMLEHARSTWRLDDPRPALVSFSVQSDMDIE